MKFMIWIHRLTSWHQHLLPQVVSGRLMKTKSWWRKSSSSERKTGFPSRSTYRAAWVASAARDGTTCSIRISFGGTGCARRTSSFWRCSTRLARSGRRSRKWVLWLAGLSAKSRIGSIKIWKAKTSTRSSILLMRRCRDPLLNSTMILALIAWLIHNSVRLQALISMTTRITPFLERNLFQIRELDPRNTNLWKVILIWLGPPTQLIVMKTRRMSRWIKERRSRWKSWSKERSKICLFTTWSMSRKVISIQRSSLTLNKSWTSSRVIWLAELILLKEIRLWIKKQLESLSKKSAPLRRPATIPHQLSCRNWTGSNHLLKVMMVFSSSSKGQILNQSARDPEITHRPKLIPA